MNTKNIRWMAIVIAMMATVCIAFTSCGSDEPKNSKDVAKMLIGTWQLDGTHDYIETITFTGASFMSRVIEDGESYESSGKYTIDSHGDESYFIVMFFDDDPAESVTVLIDEITQKKLVLYLSGETSTWTKIL